MNTKAPEFNLFGDNNEEYSLKKAAGKYLVLYFYPRDSTPGCTTEAQDFSRLRKAFSEKNALVWGVSTDTIASHQKFKKKCSLEVTLLSDETHEMHEKYGTWGEKNLYGKKSMGTLRTTILIDPKGNCIKRFDKVKVANHAQFVLESIP